jgi:phosphoribosyl 1,2-cyclic phosphate phosphodiesterase
MSIKGSFLFYGSGGSTGVPVIGCDCSVCQSDSPCNKRLRPSGLLTVGDRQLLIDCGPDFREQALRYDLRELDGVLLTHTHYDHIGGIDDLRIFFFRYEEPLPCLLSKSSYKALQNRLHYMFAPQAHGNNIPVQLDFQVLPDSRGEVEFRGVSVRYLTYRQGGMLVNGYRFGDFAYITDISDYSDTIFEDLEGCETLVVSALRHNPSHVHFTINEAVAFARKVGVKRTWFNHISHQLDHEETNALLPPDIQLAYDGLTIEFQVKS